MFGHFNWLGDLVDSIYYLVTSTRGFLMHPELFYYMVRIIHYLSDELTRKYSGGNFILISKCACLFHFISGFKSYIAVYSYCCGVLVNNERIQHFLENIRISINTGITINHFQELSFFFILLLDVTYLSFVFWSYKLIQMNCDPKI